MEEKKKGKIVPILIAIIFILLVAIGVLVFITFNKNSVTNTPTDLTETVNKDNEKVESEKEEVKKQEEKVPDYSAKIQEVYNKIGEENFLSKDENANVSSQGKLYTVSNGEIVYNNGNTKNLKFKFDYGVPKYVLQSIKGGQLVGLFVLTESGEVYIINSLDDNFILDTNYDPSRFQVSKMEMSEKIIDITGGKNSVTVPYSGPYFLTEKGNLINEKGKTYDEINRNHVKYMGSLGMMVYINKDNTFEIIRNHNTYEYMEIIDDKGNKVKGKFIFYGSNSGKETCYIVNENDILLQFNNDSLMVAQSLYPYSENKIKDIKYDGKSKVEILLENGEKHTLDNISQYVQL